jgi:hypothetical protein
MVVEVSKMIELDSIKIPFPETSYVTCSGFPKLFVGTKNLYMNCSKVPSLSGSNKIINCEKLKFCFAHNIKGNILSLMIMSKLKKVEATTTDWLDIINKHLTGDRDLLDCKEELMNAGLKEYAKL